MTVLRSKTQQKAGAAWMAVDARFVELLGHCTSEDDVADAMHDIAVALKRADLMEEALRHLEGWDMLTLRPDGHGAATADAPWARDMIAKALADRGRCNACGER